MTETQLNLTLPPKYSNLEIEALCIAVNNLRSEVKELMLTTLISKDNLPEEMAHTAVNAYMKQKYKLRRSPLEGEIADAISKTNSMRAAAEYLGISPTTLKRYCDLYQKNSEGGPTPLQLWCPTRGTKVISKSILP